MSRTLVTDDDSTILLSNSSGSTITAGTPTVFGIYVAIPKVSIADGATGAAWIKGIHTMAKDSSTIAQGDILYLDGSGDVSTTGVPSLKRAGYAAAAAATGATTVSVVLNGVPGAVGAAE